MKAFLMYPHQDFDVEADLPSGAQALIEDLGLQTLFGGMSGDDEFLYAVAEHAVLASLDEPEAVRYRQDALQDCLDQPETVREMYQIAVEAVLGSKKIYRGIFSQSPDATLRWAMEMLQLFTGLLRRLREIADTSAAGFRSQAFCTLFQTLAAELGDDFFAAVDEHLSQLRFRGGVLISARLGKGAKGIRYLLRRPGERRQSFLHRVTGKDSDGVTMRIADRDESGHRTLAELRGRGINLAANALAQSADHMLSFFTKLRCELGFYVGCLNVHDRLAEVGEPMCFPEPVAADEPTRLSFHGLYDVCLSLRLDRRRAVGNDVRADGKKLVIITGANQGGKSTFLRSVGLAQLMMQCGMFVGAESFASTVCTGLFTHYRREEDADMVSGKLDEELARMSEIADQVHPGSIVLFNESFAATNEREGSEIARQIVRALLESGVRVFLVTHFFDLAHSLYRQGSGESLFLRAQRRDDGQRTFRLVEGEPEPTSYGLDLYQRIFGTAAQAQSAATR
jgi:MutS domain V